MPLAISSDERPPLASTFAQICEILEKDFHVARVSVTSATALTDLGLDSLKLLTFVCTAENAFHVRIDPAGLGQGAALDLRGLCKLLDIEGAANDGW